MGVFASEAVPGALGRVTAVFTTWGFVLFAALAAAAVLGIRPAARRRGTATAVVGGLSSLVAAGAGRVVKWAVAEPRPCQLDPAEARWTRCPGAGNWSFPSNHAVYAGALAVTVVVLARATRRDGIAAAAVVLAAAIAGSRVVLGVHYWWDVVAGLLWGAGVGVLTLLVLAPRVADRVRARRRPRPTNAGVR